VCSYALAAQAIREGRVLSDLLCSAFFASILGKGVDWEKNAELQPFASLLQTVTTLNSRINLWLLFALHSWMKPQALMMQSANGESPFWKFLLDQPPALALRSPSSSFSLHRKWFHSISLSLAFSASTSTSNTTKSAKRCHYRSKKRRAQSASPILQPPRKKMETSKASNTRVEKQSLPQNLQPTPTSWGQAKYLSC